MQLENSVIKYISYRHRSFQLCCYIKFTFLITAYCCRDRLEVNDQHKLLSQSRFTFTLLLTTLPNMNKGYRSLIVFKSKLELK